MSNAQLLRNARVWVSTAKVEADITPLNTKEILVQSDLSFSQSTSSSDINLDEAGPVPARGSDRFNDALDPVEWSFSTYIRAFWDPNLNGDAIEDDGGVVVADAILWHCLASSKTFDIANQSNAVRANAKNFVVGFGENQAHVLETCTLYIKTGDIWFKISDAQVGQAEIAFDITNISQVAWSGSGTTLGRMTSQPFDPESPDYKFSDATFVQATYLKNKLTVIKMKDNSDNQEYTIPITGGSITINNNITYLTPDTMSRLDQAIGSFTGTFEVTGSLTAYLRVAGSGGPDKYVGDLLDKMQAERKVKNSFDVAVCIGGISTKADGLVNNLNTELSKKNPVTVIHLPTCHMSAPAIESQDVIGTTLEFKAIPSDFSVSDAIVVSHTNDANTTLVDNFIANGDMNYTPII
jgi:hypothetical protein